MKLSNRLFPAIFIALTSIISSNLYSQECDLQNPINNLNQSLDNFVRAADGGGQVFKAGVTGSLMSLRFADTMCGSSVSFNIRDYVGLGNPYGGAVLASGTASENTWGQFISTLSVTPILNADSYYVIQITSGCPVFTTTNSYDGEIIFTCTPGGSCPGWGEGNGTTGDLMIQTSICPSDEDYQFGCMYESSCNYDPTAQINAGCDYSDCYGCTDETACNFDATSVHDDNSCLELDCAGACGGASVVDCNGDCGGSAYIQCGSCVAGNTGISPIAEDLSFVGGSTYNFVDQSYCEQTFIPSASGILEYIKTHSACSPNFTTLRVETTSGQVLATYSSIATSSAFKTNTSSNPTYLEAGETYIIRVTGGCVRYTNSDIYPGELTLNGYTGWGEDYTQGGDLNISTFYCPAIGGCMDETACNYDEIANADDGSCVYINVGECDCDGNILDALNICNGTCLSDADSDGVCDDVDECIGAYDECGVCNGDNSSCSGCIDESACDYDPEAIFQAFTEGSGEGTLIFTWTQTGSYANEVSVTIAGITFNTTNPPTLNLNPGIYTVYGNDSYGDGWNGYVLGVTDVSSGTFTSLTFTTGYSGSVEVEVTSLQETLCTYGAYDECGTCDNDSSNDCEQDCAGNWGGDAVLDECGTCNGEGFAEGTCDCDGNVIDNCGVCGGSDSCCDNLLSVTSMDASCNSLDGSVTASILDCEMTTVSLSPMTQNFLTIVSNAMNMDEYPWDLCFNDGMCYMIEMTMMEGIVYGDGSYIDFFMVSEELMDLSMNNSQSSCSVTWTNEAGDFVGDGMTLGGLASGLYTANMTHSNGCTDAQIIEVGYSCAGCMDPLACNYSDIANQDDGLCQYLDSCGVCDGAGIAEGACDCDGNVLDATGVCGGDCEDDYNGNGVCDNAEIHGCTYSDASNYNPEATDDNGSCTYDNCDPNAGYDSGYAAGESSVDITSDNESVYNQGYEAGSESVICPETSSCPSDLDGNGSITTSDLLVFLSTFGQICD